MQHPPANPERGLGIVIIPIPGAHTKIRRARSSTLGRDRSRLIHTTFVLALDGMETIGQTPIDRRVPFWGGPGGACYDNYRLVGLTLSRWLSVVLRDRSFHATELRRVSQHSWKHVSHIAGWEILLALILLYWLGYGPRTRRCQSIMLVRVWLLLAYT
ncbi:hypothetical protein F5Y12DRAFT_622660 [Xylaria sp. FL1777]|nr:hypothetical protein F5Y12DRAFT_622660 [Xylaria sp. FL1777]